MSLSPTPALPPASKVASVAPMFSTSATPIVVPRIPIGMGTLSVEAEARDAGGKQKAALLWARGADMLTSGEPKYATCDSFGRSGASGFIGGKMGLPPEWVDDAAPVATR